VSLNRREAAERNRRVKVMATATMLLAAIVLSTPLAAVEYEYDSIGRLVRVVEENGDAIEYAYDAVGNRVRLKVTGSATAVPGPGNPAIADLDGDGLVTLEDLSMLRGVYLGGTDTACGPLTGDLNQDGTADREDFRFWYRAYPGGDLIPGDWTGAEAFARGSRPGAAPDDRVEFWDLALLAKYWRERLEDPDASEAGRIFEAGAPTQEDLEALRRNWHQGRGPVGPRCAGGEPLAGDPARNIAEGAGALRAEAATHPVPSAGSFCLEIWISSPPEDLTCFEMLLTSDPPLEGISTEGDDGDNSDESILRLNLPDGGTGFAQVDRLERGWRITGAFLDGAPSPEGNELLLCTVQLPGKLETGTISLTDALVATAAGGVESAAAWSGTAGPSRTPARFALLPNVPNPFNPSTILRFELESACEATLRIYDVAGRLVATLVDEPLGPGVHEVTWEGRDINGKPVATGVYFYQLRAGNFVANRRMSLLK